MSRTFKIDKKQIIERLSKVKGVKAIRLTIEDEVSNEYEGSIRVLYEFQQGEDTSILNKSIELQKEVQDLISTNDMFIYIAVRAMDDPRLFYGGNYELLNSTQVIEVNKNDR